MITNSTKRNIISTAMLCLLINGCALTQLNQDAENVCQQQFRQAVDQNDPELSISALRSIDRFPDDDCRIQTQAAITYLTLSVQTEDETFLTEVGRLHELVSDRALHQIDERLQVLLYLGRRGGVDAGEMRATHEIRSAVDKICADEYEGRTFGLKQRIGDVRELNAQTFRKEVTLGCLAAVKGDQGLAAGRVVRAGNMLRAGVSNTVGQCSAVFYQHSIPQAVLASWVECRLQEEIGVDMQQILAIGGEQI